MKTFEVSVRMDGAICLKWVLAEKEEHVKKLMESSFDIVLIEEVLANFELSDFDLIINSSLMGNELRMDKE